ncbi:uncharacterized protein C2845_PM07G15980 [Panicum miliaceum]|uniref:F-box domain-containing protein n=1 Tax=Panicum miliaceum TaxID=4540 RepID=A0A3L6SQ57_PANMI|nr:uncharacterized protein C2845_PM07G15980 [Panicum miliaceum]
MPGKCRRPAPPDGDGDATAVLDDADLEEILLRFPSAADLARTAALVCRRWRRVASGPAFLRRFRRLHPSQLLGFFICKGGRPYRYNVLDRSPLPVLDPTFQPLELNPGVGGAVSRCRSFSLTSLPSVDHWSLADSSDGLLLFCSSCDRSSCFFLELPDRRYIPKYFAVCDPLSGHSVLLPAPDSGLHLGFYYLGAALVISDKDEGDVVSFEVLVVTYVHEEGPCLCVFSSSSRQWAVLLCPDICRLYKYRMPWFDDGARASGCVYWVVQELDFEHILVLDSQTKKFSTINLPCSHV